MVGDTWKTETAPMLFPPYQLAIFRVQTHDTEM